MGKMPIECKGGRTRQSEKDSCDINIIVDRWKKTGTMPLNSLMKQPLYGDFSKVPKFQEALNIVSVANTQFSKLPVEIRKLFHYEVENFLEFVNNPDNNEQMYELGIKDRPVKETPDKVEEVVTGKKIDNNLKK